MWVEHRGRQVCMCGEWALIVKMRVMEWGGGLQIPEVSDSGLNPVAQLGSLYFPLVAAHSQ